MLKIYYGPMFSGKTEMLIKEYNKYSQGDALAFKPIIDTRNKQVIKSRSGKSIIAIEINDIREIKNYINKTIKAIVIDEAFMLRGNLNAVLRDIVAQNVNVYVATLYKDFNNNNFKNIQNLIKNASSNEKHKMLAKCSICQEEAWYSVRISNSKNKNRKKIAIESDKIKYEPRCVSHRND